MSPVRIFVSPGSSRRSLRAPARTSVLALGVALLVPAPLRAQTTADDARAEALFEAAKQLRDAGHVADACPLFAESERLAPGVGIKLYLADCYQRAGRTASAWAEFRRAEKLADQRGDMRARLARTRAAELEPKLNRLTIAVPESPLHPGLELQLDQAPLPKEYWHEAMAADPGDHVVTVRVPGREPRTLAAHVDAATPVVLVSVDEPGREAAPPPPALLAEPPRGSPSSGTTRRWVGIGLLGATAVGFAAGASLLAVKDHGMSDGGSGGSSWAGPAATVAFSAAGTAFAAAVVLYLTATSDGRSQAIVAPAAFSNGGGALIRTTF
jgi:hypothetical protein